MADQGFNIGGKFFPFVRYEDWRNQDFALARQLTKVTTDELFGDAVMLEMALQAIAFKHKNPQVGDEQIVAFIGSLKPGDVEDVGFDLEDESGPLDGSEPSENANSSTQTSDEPSEPTPETSLTTSSGSPGSDTGSPE